MSNFEFSDKQYVILLKYFKGDVIYLDKTILKDIKKNKFNDEDIKEVDRDIIKQIVGHSKDFTFGIYGGNPYSSKQLFKGISKVSYSKIRFDRLKVDWKDKLGW